MDYVEIDLDGKRYEAEYIISDGGVMTVFGDNGKKFTAMHGMDE